jgi:glycosyltransferase involved in cell wall biosynthesis
MSTTPTLRLPELTTRMLQTVAREAAERRVRLSESLRCRATFNISFVITVCNQKTSVRDLYTRIALACSVRDLPFEIIFVDRSSNDGSWEEVVQLSMSDSRIHATRKRLGSSSADALAAAFRISSGDLVLTLNAGCDEAAIINGFMDSLDEGRKIGRVESLLDNELSAHVYRRMKSGASEASALLSAGRRNFNENGCKAAQTNALCN